MPSETSTANPSLSELTKLITPGVLGFYTHYEVTQVFATLDAQDRTVNVFTILVAEDRENDTPEEFTLLNRQRIKLKSLPGWAFGVVRYTRPITDLMPVLSLLNKGEGWHQSGKTLNFGNVVAVPRQFAPPDATGQIPWNRVLKNNFWGGSHLFEWSDREKRILQPLFDDTRRLQEFSEEIQKYVPIGLAALSDRLGNLVVQLPVTVLMSAFQQQHASSNFRVQLAWHPKAPPRPLRAVCELKFDGAISGYMSLPAQAPETILPMHAGRGLHQGVIWDEQNEIVLAATGPSAFIDTISFTIQTTDPEPRTFVIRQKGGAFKTYRIALTNLPIKSLVGELHGDNNGGWTQKRMYKEQADLLAKERRFVQYRPEPGQQDLEREKALADLRHLINQYGQEGAWLWDPYLSARDILETLFHCIHSRSDLRALTSAREAPSGALMTSTKGDPSKQGLFFHAWKWFTDYWCPSATKPDFVQRQQAELDQSESNWRGLCLEFRMRHGVAGWGFHDRFLIFPKADSGALAWSLGTSVNSVGTEHHILQRVDDGQLVMDAFVDLWDRLKGAEHLIWKKP